VAPLAEYQQILAGFPTRPSAESARRMEALVAAYPDFALADRALLWLADLAAREGRADEAERRYREVEQRFPDGEAWARARAGRADLALARHRPLRARALYRALVDGAHRVPPEVAARARAGLEACAAALRGLAAFAIALAYLAALDAARVPAARPLERRLPFELRFYLPIAALFVAGAVSAGRAIAWATLLIAVGGALVLGATALAASRAPAPLPTRKRLLMAATTALAVGAVVYVAVFATGLGDVLVETVRSGPER
jgi:hypothetical protein